MRAARAHNAGRFLALEGTNIATRETAWQPGLVPGLAVMPLHEFDAISTALVRWAPNVRHQPRPKAGGWMPWFDSSIRAYIVSWTSPIVLAVTA